MIQILRPDQGPASLKKSGERQTQLDCAAYDLNPDDYCSGKASFPKRKYYSRKDVKGLLVEAHHRKCCYCERILDRDNLHVEHFRPKCGVRQELGQKNDELPGYYWLAYRWENLLLSCHGCNSRFKHTLFPLANPAERARSHHDDITREDPLFVDPVRQDPRVHIRFEDDLPIGITPQGRTTIDGIGLRRVELREDRLKLLEKIMIINAFIELADEDDTNNAKLQAKAQEALQLMPPQQNLWVKFGSGSPPSAW